MNPTEITDLQDFCLNISENINSLFPNVNLHFLVCPKDRKNQAIAVTLSKLSSHAAYTIACGLCKSWAASPIGTTFLGLSIGQEGVLLSFQTKSKILAFIGIDTDSYRNLEDAKLDTHTMVALFLSTYSSHIKKPRNLVGNVMPTKESDVSSCAINMKADIYGALQSVRDGQYDCAIKLAKHRVMQTLTPQTTIRPEEHPFPIALDVINYTIESQIPSAVYIRNPDTVLSQFQLADHITSCFEVENYESWIQFASSGQILAWGGFSPSQILGAAINTSTNPFIKAIGHMAAEIVNLAPTDADHLPNGYNPFLAEEINQIRHERSIDELFEIILIHAIEAQSHLPFLRVAKNQNDGLLKGKFLGWCANALYAAAKAYVTATDRGIPPIQAARLEFQSVKLQGNWKKLFQLGQHVLALNRLGATVTIEKLIKWAEQTSESKYILDTLKIDFSNLQQLVFPTPQPPPPEPPPPPVQILDPAQLRPVKSAQPSVSLSQPILQASRVLPTKANLTFETED